MKRLFAVMFLLSLPASHSFAGWSVTERVTNDTGWSGLAGSNGDAIAVDASGRVHLVWHDESGAGQVFYGYRDPQTGWHAPAAAVSHGAVNPGDASIFLMPDGSLVVIWEDRRSGRPAIYRNVCNAAGEWGAADEEVSGSSGDARTPSGLLDATGALHLLWQDGRDGGWRIYTRIFETDGTAGDPVALTSFGGSAWNPSLARGLGSDLHLTWHEATQQGWKVLYKLYRAQAGWDSAGQAITVFPSTSWDARLAVDPAGIIHLFWSDDRSSNFEIYYKKRYPGLPWGNDKAFTSAANTSSGPRPVMDSAGNLHVIWEDFRSGLSAIYYKKITAETGWDRRDTPLTDGASTAWDPSAALDSHGDLHVVWSGNETGNFEIYYRVGRALIPTAIALRRFEAAPTGEAIRVAWDLEEMAARVLLLRRSDDDPSGRTIYAPDGGGRSGSWIDREIVPGMRYEYRLAIVDREGNETVHGPVIAIAPEAMGVSVSPNPFRISTTLTAPYPSRGGMTALVCDTRGRVVTMLPVQANSGTATITWNGLDRHGRRAAAGRYWIRVSAGGRTRTAPVLLLPD